jgi:hypothetical protein
MRSTKPQIPETEADWQGAVLDLAELCGWKRAHFRRARTKHGWVTPVAADGKGFPDLVLVKPGRGVIFVECKSDEGVPSREQKAWRDVLLASGAEWYLWRPSDWDEVVRVLQRREKRAA